MGRVVGRLKNAFMQAMNLSLALGSKGGIWVTVSGTEAKMDGTGDGESVIS